MIAIDDFTIDADMFLVPDFEENFEILSGKNSGRTQDGNMYIEPIGTYYNYQFTIIRRANCPLATWDEAFHRLSDPNNVHLITVYHDQGTWSFTAYISSGSRRLVSIEGSKKLWSAITCQFTAMEPQRRP